MLTREDLQAIGGLLQPINDRLERLEDKVDVLEGYVTAHRADFAQYHARTLPLVNHLTENWLDFAARAGELDTVKEQIEDHGIRLSVIEGSIKKAQ